MDHFKYESVQDVETVVDFLQALADGFREGRLVFTRGGEEMEFEPQGLVGFTVDARSQGASRKLRIKLGWKEQSEEEAETEPLIVRVGGKEE